MLYLALTSLGWEEGGVEAIEGKTGLRGGGPFSKSVLAFFCIGPPSLLTLTMSPTLLAGWIGGAPGFLESWALLTRCCSMFWRVLPGGRPGPRFFSFSNLCGLGATGAIELGRVEAKVDEATLVVLVVMFEVGKFFVTSVFFRCRPEREEKENANFAWKFRRIPLYFQVHTKGGKRAKVDIWDWVICPSIFFSLNIHLLFHST